MIVAEKLRAICQQMPEYELQKTPRPRPRDFYDIHTVQTVERIDFEDGDFRELIREVFRAKDVPMNLLEKVSDGTVRRYHASGWDQVLDTLRDRRRARPFDFYFDFVASKVAKLKSLWEV